jgi:hypothetical protein
VDDVSWVRLGRIEASMHAPLSEHLHLSRRRWEAKSTGCPKESPDFGLVAWAIGTFIEEEIIRLAERRAAEQGGSLSDVIQAALVRYLSAGVAGLKERERAYPLFCERPPSRSSVAGSVYFL